jgi:hypothetical protein
LPPAARGTLFEKTAPLDPPQKLLINFIVSRQELFIMTGCHKDAARISKTATFNLITMKVLYHQKFHSAMRWKALVFNE